MPVTLIQQILLSRLRGLKQNDSPAFTCATSQLSARDLFDNRDLTIPAEWNVRSNRPALKLDYIASAIDIGTLTICGFKQALLGSELWDGSIRRLTVSICSDPDGTVPAVWLGSQHGDNSNALKFYDMRIEHCPFSLECGFIEHVRFINGKIETKRKKMQPTMSLKLMILPRGTSSTICNLLPPRRQKPRFCMTREMAKIQ